MAVIYIVAAHESNSLQSIFPLLVSCNVCLSYNICILQHRHFQDCQGPVTKDISQCAKSWSQDVTDNGKKDTRRNASQTWLRNQRKRSLTCAIIVVGFIACYVPKLVELLLNFVKGDSVELPYICAKIAETCLFINSSLNPVIYVLRISGIRLEIIRVLQSVRKTVVDMNILPRDI